MLQAEKKVHFYLHHVLKVKSVLLGKRPHYRYQEKKRQTDRLREGGRKRTENETCGFEESETHPKLISRSVLPVGSKRKADVSIL